MLTRSRSRSSEMSDSPENTEGSQDSPSLSQLDSAPKDNYVPKKRNRRGPPRKADRWVCIMPEAFHSLQMGETESAPEKQLCNSLVLLKDPSSSMFVSFVNINYNCGFLIISIEETNRIAITN